MPAGSSFTTAIDLRLGLPVAVGGPYVCGATLDVYASHALCCKRKAGRGIRTSQVNTRIKAALADAGNLSVLEPSGLTRQEGKRPDGATVLPYEEGLPMAWNATLIHTCAPSYLRVSAHEAGVAASAAEERKRLKYSSLSGRVVFYPVDLETLGAFGRSASELFDTIARRVEELSGDIGARARLHRQIAAAVQLGTRRASLRPEAADFCLT